MIYSLDSMLRAKTTKEPHRFLLRPPYASAPVAQWIERLFPKENVVGSIPIRGNIFLLGRVHGDVVCLVSLFSGQSVSRRLRGDARGAWMMLVFVLRISIFAKIFESIRSRGFLARNNFLFASPRDRLLVSRGTAMLFTCRTHPDGVLRGWRGQEKASGCADAVERFEIVFRGVHFRFYTVISPARPLLPYAFFLVS